MTGSSAANAGRHVGSAKRASTDTPSSALNTPPTWPLSSPSLTVRAKLPRSPLKAGQRPRIEAGRICSLGCGSGWRRRIFLARRISADKRGRRSLGFGVGANPTCIAASEKQGKSIPRTPIVRVQLNARGELCLLASPEPNFFFLGGVSLLRLRRSVQHAPQHAVLAGLVGVLEVGLGSQPCFAFGMTACSSFW